MRFRLRTLVILLAIGQVVLAGGVKVWSDHRKWSEKDKAMRARKVWTDDRKRGTSLPGTGITPYRRYN
jgi:hypothetical protein